MSDHESDNYNETIHDLYECCDVNPNIKFVDLVILPSEECKKDYFGNSIGNINKEKVVLLVYIDLIQNKKVHPIHIKHCLVTNRLDELIHAYNTFKKFVWYREFCRMNIKLNKENYKFLDKSKWNKIGSDDNCAECGKDGVYSKNKLRYCVNCNSQSCEDCLIKHSKNNLYYCNWCIPDSFDEDDEDENNNISIIYKDKVYSNDDSDDHSKESKEDYYIPTLNEIENFRKRKMVKF